MQLSPLWEGRDTSFEKKLESSSPKDALCQVWLKMAHWFWRRRFSKVANVVFSLCCYYLPLKKCMAPNLNKFEFPLPKNTLCHVLLKIAHRFWSCQHFFNLYYYLPWEKGQGSLFERNWIPLTQGCSVPSLVEIGPVVLETKSSMYFHYVAIISFDKDRAWPFIWTNLNHLHLVMLYVKYGGYWHGDSEEVNMWKDMDGH